MIDNYLKEQLNRNKVLTNKSNKVDVVNYECFSGTASLGVSAIGNSFGFIGIRAYGVEGYIKIFYNDDLIIEVNHDSDTLIPISFVKNAKIVVEGVCLRLAIYLEGAIFLNNPKKYAISNKTFVVEAGNTFLYQYQDKNDILSLENLLRFDLGKTSCVQSIQIDSNILTAKVVVTNGVYLSTSVDNYATSKKIFDHADSVAFFQNIANNNLFFVRIFDGDISYAVVDKEGKVVSDTLITGMRKAVPVDVVVSSSEFLIHSFFAIKYDDGSFDLFVVKNNNVVEKIWQIKADNLKLHESDKMLIVCVHKNYCANIYRFNIDWDAMRSDILIEDGISTFKNVLDCDIVGNAYLLTSMGLNRYFGESTD